MLEATTSAGLNHLLDIKPVDIITIILGSGVVAAIFTAIANFIQQDIFKKREQEERRYRSLYGPLYFYLMCIDSVDRQVKTIQEAGKKGMDEIKEIRNPDRAMEQTTAHLTSQYGMQNDLIMLWWKYIEKIVKLFENNPDKIKQDHLPLVKEFIDGYIAREYLGKDKSKETIYLQVSEERMKILSAVEELKKAILAS